MSPTSAAALVTVALGLALASFIVAIDQKEAMRRCGALHSHDTCFAALNR